MNFRIKKYPRGYVVEVEKQRRHLLFFKKKYWALYVSTYGLPDLPWHHSTAEHAMMSLLDKIKYETINNSVDFYLK